MKELSYLAQAFKALALWVKVVIVVLLATTLIGAAAFFGMQVALLVALARLHGFGMPTNIFSKYSVNASAEKAA